MNRLSDFAIKAPKFTIWLAVATTMIVAALVLAPSLSNTAAQYLNPLTIDADPENMLLEDDPVRITNRQQKKQFTLYDLVVVGVVNTDNSEGVFNPQTLADIYDLTEFASGISWVDEDGETQGVVPYDIISPSAVDNIEQAGPGTVRFDWLMETAPKTDAAAIAVRERAQNQPLLKGSLVSDDGKGIALYFPLTSKGVSNRVVEMLEEHIASYNTGDAYHISGLPIAQDRFAVEMFIQMAISSPLAMGLIFALLWYFFRNMTLIIAPMIVAMISTILTMGLLVVFGNSVHIMSSMIPIFIMPVAVLDAIHILSDFYDRYPIYKNRVETIKHVMKELAKPMLFTSLTTVVGFASLNLTPLPPIQLFGTFVAIGVFAAWLLTITIVPAYIVLMPERKFLNFGMKREGVNAENSNSMLARSLKKFGAGAHRRAIPILVLVVAVATVAGYGVTKIVPNDNPVKWFAKDHQLRKSDKVLNQMFAGSYMAYLSFSPESTAAKSDEDQQTFKDPATLNYIAGLQAYMGQTGLVGKSNSVVEIVKTVHRELFEGKQAFYRIPDTAAGVAQTLITFESSHRPQDLWHYVTPDYQNANIWLQLKTGDNQTMSQLETLVDQYLIDNPAPIALQHKWFGLTYVNITWQDQMVVGMGKALASSFVVVAIMMMFLYRSILWGLLAMVPLSFSVAVLYGTVGLLGIDYDAPIAILSALSLGLAIDYAIHFLTRARRLHLEYDNWPDTVAAVFGEPARAISRNVVVLGIGFMPLLLAPLVPYQTVGIFISGILLFAGLATLAILPALMRYLERWLFTGKEKANALADLAEQEL